MQGYDEKPSSVHLDRLRQEWANKIRRAGAIRLSTMTVNDYHKLSQFASYVVGWYTSDQLFQDFENFLKEHGV